MDPFDELPVELRETIFEHMDSRESLSRICRASPSMFQQSRMSKPLILWTMLQKELPGDLFQDALAIITFPTQASDIDKHIQAWGSKSLPDRLSDHPETDVFALNSLYLRLRGYIDDYLCKATSKVLLHIAYRRLPSWAHPSHSNKSFDEEAADGPSEKRVCMASLSIRERHRLLRAFLRFELTCKASRPRPLAHITDDEHVALISTMSDAQYAAWDNDRFEEGWILDLPYQEVRDWRLLAKIERTPEISSAEEWWEEEILLCVQEYVVTLWKALCVRHILCHPRKNFSSHALPHNASPVPRRQPVRLFGTHEPTVARPFTLQNLSSYDIGSSYTYTLLAGFGFDLLDTLVKSDKSDLSFAVAQFCEELRYRHPDTLPRIIVRPCSKNPSEWESDNGTWDKGPPALWQGLVSSIWPIQEYFWTHRVAYCPFLRRAWPFLDSTDYYSPDSTTGKAWYNGWGDWCKTRCADYCRSYVSMRASTFEYWTTDMFESNELHELSFGKEEFRTGEWDYYPSVTRWLIPFWR